MSRIIPMRDITILNKNHLIMSDIGIMCDIINEKMRQ